jgi:hypothetical protein
VATHPQLAPVCGHGDRRQLGSLEAPPTIGRPRTRRGRHADRTLRSGGRYRRLSSADSCARQSSVLTQWCRSPWIPSRTAARHCSGYACPSHHSPRTYIRPSVPEHCSLFPASSLFLMSRPPPVVPDSNDAAQSVGLDGRCPIRIPRASWPKKSWPGGFVVAGRSAGGRPGREPRTLPNEPREVLLHPDASVGGPPPPNHGARPSLTLPEKVGVPIGNSASHMPSLMRFPL